nr:MAG TPA: holin [Caudoviricetes sp.]
MMNKDVIYSIVGSRKVWVAFGGIATAICALLRVDPTLSANILGIITAIGATASIIVEKITNKKVDDESNENV